MISPRNIDLNTDRETLLEFHCLINYESDSPWARKIPYEQYRLRWMNSSGPEEYLSHLEESLADKRTIAEIWENSGDVSGYIWAVFTDISDHNIVIVELKDILVTENYRHQGTSRIILEHAEQLARERGADIFRSETGIDNIASQKMHEAVGFNTYHSLYEKLLTDPVKKIVNNSIQQQEM